MDRYKEDLINEKLELYKAGKKEPLIFKGGQ